MAGTKTPKSVRPANLSGIPKRRYGRTLTGITAPAVAAAMVTGMLFANGMPKAQPELDLAERVNMMRAAQDKRATPQGTLTSALQQPLQNSDDVAR